MQSIKRVCLIPLCFFYRTAVKFKIVPKVHYNLLQENDLLSNFLFSTFNVQTVFCTQIEPYNTPRVLNSFYL